MPAMTAAQQHQAIIVANSNARQLIARQALKMMQPIFSTVVVPATQNVFNIPLRYVGLVTGFLVELTGTITNGAATALNLTDYNLANLLSQVQFTDLQNNVRINTTGWHLNAINSAKGGRVFGAANTTDSPIKYGSNWPVIQATGFPVAALGVGTYSMYYWVPLAYNARAWDLRGAMFANVVNATANLQLTFNPNATAFVATGTDGTLAVGIGNAGAVNTSINLTVYQVYLDQLPIDNKGQFILPPLDISTIYELRNTNFTAIVAGQDFPIPYANFRDFMSTCVLYDRAGTLSVGNDINYWTLQSANLTNIFKKSPFAVALDGRAAIGDDFPKGLYYFDHRDKPLSSIQYGNMALNLNASIVGANANAFVGWESLALQNAVSGAGSLPAN